MEPFLITPFRSAAEGTQESRFNTVHAKARNVIERTIGVLKSRFRCLLSARGLHYTPEKATQITNVCCALHNLSKHFKTEFNDELPFPLDTEVEVGEPSESNIEESAQIRNNLMLAILNE